MPLSLRHLLPLALTLLAPLTLAQAPRWTADSTGTGSFGDDMVAMKTDAAGNVYVLGNVRKANRDIRLIKYSPAGAQLWLVDYNGTANDDDFADDFTLDAAGNVYVCGQVDGAFGAIMRFNAANGALAWDTLETDVSRYQQIILTSSTSVTAVGYAQSFYADIRCARFVAASGTRQWTVNKDTQMSFPGTQRIKMDSATNVYIAGTVDEDYWVGKVNSAGVAQWEGVFDGFTGLDELCDMAVDGTNGFVYITGSSDVFGFDNDWDTFKINATTGARVWEKVFNGPGSGNDRPSRIIVDGQSNVIVVGEADAGNSLDVTVAKYTPTASTLWVRSYNGPANKDDFAFDAIVDGTSNTLMIAGTATGNNRQDMLAWKLDTNGNTQWAALNNGADNGNDRGRAIALDAAKNVILAGSVFKVSTNYDLRVTKYYQATLTPSVLSIAGGNPISFAVNLNENAASALNMVIADNNLDTTVPASVTVAAGSNAASFNMTTKAVLVATPVTVTVGFLTTTVVIKPAVPFTLVVTPASVVGGTSVTGTVTLDGPAPVGGLVLACWDTNTALNAPGSVTVPEGATTVTFTVTTNTVTSTSNGYVKVGANGVTKTSAIIAVRP